MLYVEQDIKKARTWLKLYKLQLPSSVKYGLNDRITHGNPTVKTSLYENAKKHASGAVNAYFDPAGNSYHIALDGVGEACLCFAMRESVHTIRTNAAEAYANIEKIVLEELQRNGQNLEELLTVQRELHPTEDEAYWREEVVANTVPAILSDPETGRQFAKRFARADVETRNWFGRLLDRVGEYLCKCFDTLKQSASWTQMAAVEQNMESLARIREAYFDALSGMQDRKQTDLRVRFSKETDAITGSDIVSNREIVHSMNSVAAIDESFALPEGGTFIERVTRAIGKGAEQNKYIGTISITGKGIRYDFQHGYGKEKIDAIPAIRAVLREGAPVDASRNWENRGYDTVLLAAPITIGETPYLMGVRVRTTDDFTNFELHEVVIQEVTTGMPFTNRTIRQSEAPWGHSSDYTKSILKLS